MKLAVIISQKPVVLLEDETDTIDTITNIITDYISWIPSFQYAIFLVLSICLIRIPSLTLVSLSKEVYFRESATTAEMNQLIVEWKKSYVLVCDIVAAMNAFIGQPIFIFFIMSMISFISMVFSIFLDILHNNLEEIDTQLLMVFNSLIWNGILILISDQIPQQVSKIDVIIKKYSKL